jgi:hypothetical protein
MQPDSVRRRRGHFLAEQLPLPRLWIFAVQDDWSPPGSSCALSSPLRSPLPSKLNSAQHSLLSSPCRPIDQDSVPQQPPPGRASTASGFTGGFPLRSSRTRRTLRMLPIGGQPGMSDGLRERLASPSQSRSRRRSLQNRSIARGARTGTTPRQSWNNQNGLRVGLCRAPSSAPGRPALCLAPSPPYLPQVPRPGVRLQPQELEGPVADWVLFLRICIRGSGHTGSSNTIRSALLERAGLPPLPSISKAAIASGFRPTVSFDDYRDTAILTSCTPGGHNRALFAGTRFALLVGPTGSPFARRSAASPQRAFACQALCWVGLSSVTVLRAQA